MTLKQTLEAGFDNFVRFADSLAHWFGWLGPYRVTVRVPVSDEEECTLTMGAFTEAQGLRLLHEWQCPGTLTKRGTLVALKN